MDFGVVGFDSSILCSNSNNNVSFALDTTNNSTDEAHQLHKWFGSGHSKQEKRSTVNEDGGEDIVAFREYKVAKTNSLSACGEQMLKNPFFQRSNNGDSNVGEGCNQQMLSFSSQHVTSSLPPYYHRHQNISGLNGANMEGIISSARAPFTPSQRVELDHQAMIFKYIIANVPVPPHLLIPIRKAFESAAYSCYSGFKSNPLLGWGTLHLGFSNNNDPEPGRCRRTDGKKWRCSRDAVGDQKYCERHMNRGRHRSRKPVEAGQSSQPSNRKTTLSESEPPSVLPKGVSGGLGLSHPYMPLMPNTNRNLSDKEDSKGRYQHKETPSSSAYSITKHQNPYQQASDNNGEFGLVCSDSLLNPINPSSSLVAYTTATSGNLSIHDEAKSGHFLRQFIDDWPKNLQHSHLSDFSSSTSSPKELDMGLSVGGFATNEQNLKGTSCAQASWETSMGGPLGEVLHANIGECKNSKPGCSLNLMVQNWDNSNNNNSYLASTSSSPTGVLQRPELNSVSNSSAGSSPRPGESEKVLDANSLCNGSIFGRGTM